MGEQSERVTACASHRHPRSGQTCGGPDNAPGHSSSCRSTANPSRSDVCCPSQVAYLHHLGNLAWGHIQSPGPKWLLGGRPITAGADTGVWRFISRRPTWNRDGPFRWKTCYGPAPLKAGRPSGGTGSLDRGCRGSR